MVESMFILYCYTILLLKVIIFLIHFIFMFFNDVIKEHYFSYTDSEFKKIVADWLHHANTRFPRTK